MSDGDTRYSKDIKGAKRNYGWVARFDVTDGFVGITQWIDGHVARVLLSPRQMLALRNFCRDSTADSSGTDEKGKECASD